LVENFKSTTESLKKLNNRKENKFFGSLFCRIFLFFRLRVMQVGLSLAKSVDDISELMKVKLLKAILLT
jgi:hypothetical protein